MKVLRYLLLPVVPIYWFVTKLRNWFFDIGIYESKSYDFPVICIGNLSTGGTGKTPMTEYLIKQLSKDYNLATLSRGYGRETKGFLLANEESNATTLGDEPFQIYSKFKNDITVAVDEKRVHGIDTLISDVSDLDIVLLDDAYQHRHVKAGFNILLTPYSKLYVNDICLPTGDLRESVGGANRANAIIVTKCPKDIDEIEQLKITKLLNPHEGQSIYFSYIDYSETVIGSNSTKPLEALKGKQFALVTGIANPVPLVNYLKSLSLNFEHLSYGDHHKFSEAEINTIKTSELILTTEKDYTRLAPHFENGNKLFYLPIEIKLTEKDSFEEQLRAFITTY